MIINHNLPALNAYNKLVVNNFMMSKSLEKLSSGLRINRAADDAAGLAISEKMRSQINGLDQATRNAQDGISLIQTAEGALNETHSILQRMRELAVQSANDTYTSDDRQQIQKEIDQLVSEIDRISSTTQFNSKNLLDGTTSALVSTDKLDTKVYMRDGLRVVDKYGQKAVGGGNFKIHINATVGKAEIDKTDIMRVKHNVFENSGDKVIVTGLGINATYGDLRANKDGVDMKVTSGVIFNFVETGTSFAVKVSGAVGDSTTGSKLYITVALSTGESLTVDQLYNKMEAAFQATKVTTGGTLTSGNISYGRTLSDFIFLQRDIAVSGGTLAIGIHGTGGVLASGGSSVVAAGTTGFIDQGYGAREGQVAQEFTRLKDIERFWDASGNFILDTPQTISVVQGNGAKGSMTLFDSDTIQSMEDKLNDLIYNQLGQKNYVDTSVRQDMFAKYIPVANDFTAPFTADSVKGTFLIQSAIAGKEGRLTFVGGDAIINALSLQTVQAASENQFTVNITNAHTNAEVAKGVKISGNKLIGVLNPNIDVEFASNADVKVTASGIDGFNQLKFSATSGYDTFVHVADRTMVFHIGANQKQDMGAGIANMSASALGVSNVLVSSNALANEAIGKIDSAISRVSSERSKLGAIQNRLDHTINNLSTTSENLTAAESRIRDVDMAKEMMNFTKYSVLSQAATAMLAQANQMPQQVLQLLR